MLEWFWKSTAVPGGISLVIAVGLVLALGRRESPWARNLAAWMGSVAMITGGLVAVTLINGWPEFPPAQSWQSVSYIALGGGLVAGLDAALRKGRGLSFAGLTVGQLFAIAAVGFTFWSLWQRNVLGPAYQVAPIAALALAILALNPFDVAQKRGLGGFLLAGAFAGWLGTASFVMILEGTARLGQIAGIFASATLGMQLLTLWKSPAAKALPGTLLTWLPAWLAALCGVAYWSTDSTNPGGFILLGLAPMALLLWPQASEPESTSYWPKGRELYLRIAALALFGLAQLGALGVTYLQSAKEEAAKASESGGGDYDYGY